MVIEINILNLKAPHAWHTLAGSSGIEESADLQGQRSAATATVSWVSQGQQRGAGTTGRGWGCCGGVKLQFRNTWAMGHCWGSNAILVTPSIREMHKTPQEIRQIGLGMWVEKSCWPRSWP
eukprot:scaffold67324_cov17-Tisochrysis_lutea.AAC.1